METSTAPQLPTSPTWQDNLLDALRARRRTWLIVAIAIVVLGALVALVAPGILPPTLVVGLAVGIAAVMLATALVLGLDSADLVVAGPRHVTAAGGFVSGVISRSPGDIAALMELIDAHSPGGDGVRLALTPASRDAGVPGARAAMVAHELANRGHKVLLTDLTRGGSPTAGLSDVLAGTHKLADAVRFDEELFLANLAVGSEPDKALAGFAGWASSLPPDLDVLVAALPPLAEPGVLPAVQGVELVLVLVEVGRTQRIDLIASLDAIDVAGVPAELILVDGAVQAQALGYTNPAAAAGDPSPHQVADDQDGSDVATRETSQDDDDLIGPMSAVAISPAEPVASTSDEGGVVASVDDDQADDATPATSDAPSQTDRPVWDESTDFDGRGEDDSGLTDELDPDEVTKIDDGADGSDEVDLTDRVDPAAEPAEPAEPAEGVVGDDPDTDGQHGPAVTGSADSDDTVVADRDHATDGATSAVPAIQQPRRRRSLWRRNEDDLELDVPDEAPGVRVIEPATSPVQQRLELDRHSAPVLGETAGPRHDDLDIDDGPAVARPGSGHVRTIRGPRPTPPPSPATTVGRGLGRATRPPETSASTSGLVPQVSALPLRHEPKDGDSIDGAQPAGDHDIDSVARETARLTASLQELAHEVWRRDDTEK